MNINSIDSNDIVQTRKQRLQRELFIVENLQRVELQVMVIKAEMVNMAQLVVVERIITHLRNQPLKAHLRIHFHHI